MAKEKVLTAELRSNGFDLANKDRQNCFLNDELTDKQETYGRTLPDMIPATTGKRSNKTKGSRKIFLSDYVQQIA
jgi:hypothetical protein